MMVTIMMIYMKKLKLIHTHIINDYITFRQKGELVKCHDTCEMECECPCLAGPDTIPCRNPEADLHR